MTTQKNNTKKNEKTLTIVKRANAERLDAYNRNVEFNTPEGRMVDLGVRAASVAEKAHKDMSWLRDKLNEAIGRVEIAENAKDAHLALAWLRTSLWDDIQAALTKLEAYDELLS
jgi:hypothetical protein